MQTFIAFSRNWTTATKLWNSLPRKWNFWLAALARPLIYHGADLAANQPMFRKIPQQGHQGVHIEFIHREPLSHST